MFPIGFSEVILILVVALVVFKPEDWPRLLYKTGQLFRKIQVFMGHGRRAVDQWMADAELEEIRERAFKRVQKEDQKDATSSNHPKVKRASDDAS